MTLAEIREKIRAMEPDWGCSFQLFDAEVDAMLRDLVLRAERAREAHVLRRLAINGVMFEDFAREKLQLKPVTYSCLLDTPTDGGERG